MAGPHDDKTFLKMAALHEAAHAVMATRIGWEVKRMVLTSNGSGYADMRPRSNRKYSARADILITLAGHAAVLRMTQLKPRAFKPLDPHREILHSLIDGPVDDDLGVVFRLLAKTGHADSIFVRFQRAMRRADSLLAEPRIWSTVEKVAVRLLRSRKLAAGELEIMLGNARPRGKNVIRLPAGGAARRKLASFSS
jgi:hypothetical protein